MTLSARSRSIPKKNVILENNCPTSPFDVNFSSHNWTLKSRYGPAGTLCLNNVVLTPMRRLYVDRRQYDVILTPCVPSGTIPRFVPATRRHIQLQDRLNIFQVYLEPQHLVSRSSFLTCETDFVLCLAVVEDSVLPMG